MPNCKKCGKQIDFVKTATGKFMPVESAAMYCVEDDNSLMLVITKSGKTIRARMPRDHESETELMICYVPHWQSCSSIAKFHKEYKSRDSKYKKLTREAERPSMRAPERSADTPTKQISFLSG